MSEEEKYYIEFSEKIAGSEKSQMFGARPVKRVIQNQVLNELSKELLSGKVSNEDHIIIDSFDGKIVFRKA